jgi:hypothetical protein
VASSNGAAGSNGAALTGGEQVADLLEQHDVVGGRSLGLLLSETRLNFFVWGDDEEIDDCSDDEEGHQRCEEQPELGVPEVGGPRRDQ